MADKKISALPAATTPLAGTEVLPIVQGGATDQVSVANLTVGRDVTVKKLNPTDNVVMAAGKGIDFSANGGDVLSQYDEGTWTPTDQSGAGLTFTVNFARYTRVGNLVTANGFLTFPSTANTSAATISLPFVPPRQAVGSAASDSTANAVNVLADSGFATFTVRNSQLGTLTNANLSGLFLFFTITYQVS